VPTQSSSFLTDTVSAHSKALELTMNRFQGGNAPRSDVSQAQTQLDAARILATDVKVERAQYEHALAILIGKPPAAFSLPPIPLNVEPGTLPSVPVALPAQLLERRPDIAAARAAHAQLQRRRRCIQACQLMGYWPPITEDTLPVRKCPRSDDRLPGADDVFASSVGSQAVRTKRSWCSKVNRWNTVRAALVTKVFVRDHFFKILGRVRGVVCELSFNKFDSLY
jgi:hypothetical protein